MQEESKGTLDIELATVLSSIALACKQIGSLVTRAGVSNLTGLAGAANIQVCSHSGLTSFVLHAPHSGNRSRSASRQYR